MVPPSSVRIPRVRTYSGYRALLFGFVYKTFTSFGRFSHTVRLPSILLVTVPTPSVLLLSVWPLSLSLATTRKISFDFSSSGYLDVSVPRVPFVNLFIQLTIYDSSSYVFPHSDICGSMLICSSPQLFAACHVLLRLLMPRHSPYALLCLNFFCHISMVLGSSQELLSSFQTVCLFRLYSPISHLFLVLANCIFSYP